MKLKDSGNRVKYKTGACREDLPGKGRYDLISPVALGRLAIVMENGARKYADRNWEKGMPMHRYMDSALRHLNQYLDGKRDEDHLGQAMFNVMALIHTEEMIKRGELSSTLNDLPIYITKSADYYRQVKKVMSIFNNIKIPVDARNIVACQERSGI